MPKGTPPAVMRAQLATAAAGPDAANEDFAAATPSAAVLLDGAGIPAGLESGCVHGVAWFARSLGTVLLAQLGDPAAGSMTRCLHEAMTEVRDRHGGACDLDHPGSPTATVVAVRVRGGQLEHLVLTDSTVVLTGPDGESEAISDPRHEDSCAALRAELERVPADDPGRADAFRAYIAAVRRLKNTPGGFFVASADPDVAGQALTGSRPLPEIASALLLSDGASRLADLFGLASFGDLAAVARQHGPAELISQVRAAEGTDPVGRRWPRSKGADDATAVYCDQFAG